MKSFKGITHAKMAQPFVHAPLFRSFEKGEQKKLKLDITYNVGDATFRFWGPEPLGATDLRVLQGLVAIATGQLKAESGIPVLLRDGLTQRMGLELEGDALKQKSIAVRFKLTAFAELLGYIRPGTATLGQLRESILRLGAITVIARRQRYDGSYHIVSGYGEDKLTGDVVVGLNPSLTAAVLGKNEFLRVDFEEVRKLKSDAARLIHSRLHWINHGTTRSISMELLCAYIYADTPATPSAFSRRKTAVHKAMKELRVLGWRIAETKTGTFTVQRPQLKQGLRRTGHKLTVERETGLTVERETGLTVERETVYGRTGNST